MAPLHHIAKAQKDGRISLAISALQKNQFSSIRKAVAVYNVPRTTLQDRKNGRQPQLGSRSKTRLLSDYEEEILVNWIHSMEQRGYPPFLIDIRRMAEVVLTRRDASIPPKPIGKHWVYRWIKAHPDLDPRLVRTLDSQRAKNEDPKIIKEWFQLVRDTQLEYGILDDDTYNFDETGFAMGMATAGSSKVATTASVGRATVIQPGSRKWTTTVECVDGCGRTIPPFIIIEGKVHLETWYRDNPDLPPNWKIAISENGWTNNELGLEWIKHFDTHTKSRVVGTHRLLILDGHGSHATPEFDQYCAENRIITLCMPPHTSHVLQPLDVACFSPLKKAYNQLVLDLARQGIFHVDKTDFLAMYSKARMTVFSEQNIKSGFRATGLIPHNPERVLSSLTITKTPSPPSTSHGPSTLSPWTSETPRNIAELAKQAELLENVLQRHSQSPTEPLSKVIKGCQLAMTGAVLLAQENIQLRATNKYLQQKKRRRRRHLQTGGVLEVQEAQQLIIQRDLAAQTVIEQSVRQTTQRAPPTCSNCHEIGHNRRGCRVPITTS
jgi:hypothetical protein